MRIVMKAPFRRTYSPHTAFLISLQRLNCEQVIFISKLLQVFYDCIEKSLELVPCHFLQRCW